MVCLETRQILCVDDAKDNCEVLSYILADAGYDVTSAYSVKEAVQLLESKSFDLCLLDLWLPDGTGFDLVEKIQALDPLMPIIICTADVRDFTRVRALEAGVQAFFTKPTDFDLLIQTIARLF